MLYIAEESIKYYSYYLLPTQLIIFYAVLMVDKSYFVIYATQWDVQDKKKAWAIAITSQQGRICVEPE